MAWLDIRDRQHMRVSGGAYSALAEYVRILLGGLRWRDGGNFTRAGAL